MYLVPQDIPHAVVLTLGNTVVLSISAVGRNVPVECGFASTETTLTHSVRDGEPRTATSPLTQLLVSASQDMISFVNLSFYDLLR